MFDNLNLLNYDYKRVDILGVGAHNLHIYVGKMTSIEKNLNVEK